MRAIHLTANASVLSQTFDTPKDRHPAGGRDPRKLKYELKFRACAGPRLRGDDGAGRADPGTKRQCHNTRIA